MSKKAAPPAPRPILGRLGSHLQMGIVGLPNVGKSTLFNVLTRLQVAAMNFPFCTIEPNISRVNVPDERFDWLCDYHKPASRVPAALQITDIAGLVRGASAGQGLGNAFLSHIRAVDGIYHVVRIFEEEDVTHVEGNIEPVRDLEIIFDELRLKDIEFLEKSIEAAERLSRTDKTKRAEIDVFRKALDWLNNERKAIRFCDWNPKEVEIINPLQLLTAKPALFLVNMSEEDYIRKKNKWLIKIKQWVDAHGGEPIIPFSAALETKLQDMSPEEARNYLTERKIITAIPKIIKSGYHAIDLVHYFTAGTDEVKCWTIKSGTPAPAAAGRIHTDFERGFVCAEVMKYQDFFELGSETAVRAGGKYVQQGKGYIVQDGDIVFFRVGQVNTTRKK
eukprot:TRINITY_DN163_c0_g3_i1.p1 TRINITY_DN163_c0_g3~~TRINITY_DN163_c0_g3_i1.p1  ORF type:complete len:391 (-),score=216.22 TRINITY_DN163_c0_g3_i1:186-1358(-)